MQNSTRVCILELLEPARISLNGRTVSKPEFPLPCREFWLLQSMKGSSPYQANRVRTQYGHSNSYAAPICLETKLVNYTGKSTN